MSREAIESIEELAEARSWLKQSGLYDVAFEVFGGSPLEWERFAKGVKWLIAVRGKDDLQHIVEQEILKVIEEASNSLGKQKLVDKNTSTIANLYKKYNGNPPFELIVNLGARPTRDNVFRIRNLSVEPLTRAMHYVIKYGREEVLSIEDLKRFVDDELRK